MTPAPHDPRVLRRPIPLRVVLASFLLAFLLTLLPLNGFLLLLRPDFMALFLVYWTVREPKLMGGWTAFALGILSDVAESSTLGIHALGYSIAYAMTAQLRPRIQSFYAANQAVHVWPILLASQGVTALAALVLNQPLPAWPWWLQSPLTSALWVLLPYVLERQIPAREPSRVP
jgi:rod shape-determining protein MreD